MSVSAGGAAACGVDRDAAAQLFTEIYEEHWGRLRWFLWRRLNASHAHLAEDLTQETFVLFWRGTVLKDKVCDVESISGLLRAIARGVLSDHYQKMSSRESTMDFSDPVNTPVIAQTQAYAAATPELASLSDDLDTAMELMTAASKLWRDQNKASHQLRVVITSEYHNQLTRPETKERIAAEVAAAEGKEDELLASFREACSRVGALRAEIEAVAGPHWRAAGSVATPLPSGRRPEPGNPYSDPSATHCLEGHLLDRANTQFGPVGDRYCRTCKAAKDRAKKPERKTPMIEVTISAEALDSARQMLLDPQHDGLSARAIAEQNGMSETTLFDRMPDVLAARRERQATATELELAPAIEAARRLLVDPQQDHLTFASVSRQTGLKVWRLRERLDAEIEARTGRQAAALEAARQMLLDPSCTLTGAAIARAHGMHYATMASRLPDEVAARRANALVGAGAQ